MDRQYYVYMTTNSTNTVTYTGVTNDLIRRIYEHKNKLVAGFTSRYNIMKLVYFEAGEDVQGAVLREKQIKSYSRKSKVRLINTVNPDWHDLYPELING